MSRSRSISNEEIALIKAMLAEGMEKTTILAYFTHPDRPVNFGRITNIQEGSYGPEVPLATPDELNAFLQRWKDRRGVSPKSLAGETIDPRTLPPVHPERLAGMFAKDERGKYVLTEGESDCVECKKGFDTGKMLRSVMGFANNMGGHILLGVEDSKYEVVGLKNNVFLEKDINFFSQTFRSVMEPVPRFEVGSCQVDGMLVGAIYVHAEHDGPVITSKSEGNVTVGTIYYRYAGESRAIQPAEFRKMLSLRDKRTREESADKILKVVELGGRAAILDLANPSAEATKIIREGIDEGDVLRNFARQTVVEFPLAYVLRSCTTAKRWLPVFYYIRQSKLPIAQVIEEVAARETTLVASKRYLIERMSGDRSAYTKPQGRVVALLKKLMAGKFDAPATSLEASYLARAISALPNAKLEFEFAMSALRKCLDVLREDKDAPAALWSYAYRAAARIDELYFGPDAAQVNETTVSDQT